MIWNRKIKVAPKDLAEALLNEYIAIAGMHASKNLVLNKTAQALFDDKARRYGIASVLIALTSEEQKNPRFAVVREELERRIFPAIPTQAGMAVLDQIKSAMSDLSALLFPDGHPTEMSWARNWLLDVGIDESNPVTLSLLAIHWFDFYITATKTLQSFRVV